MGTARFSILRRLSTSAEPPPGALVSKHDTHFFNNFSVVIGILVTVAILLIVLARNVASGTQIEHVKTDPMQVQEVDARLQPFARVAVAGQDNSTMNIPVASGEPAPAAMAVPTTGEELYQSTCSVCHGMGIGGAPKFGDNAAWGARVAQGKATLYKHALEGYTGKSGMMPAKGGRVDLADDLVKQAVDHMTAGM
jgi:cytochrome c5